MARGRKKKVDSENKSGYFYENEENAVINYVLFIFITE